MARKGELDLLLEELFHAPWWVSVVVAAGVYIGVGKVLPLFVGGVIVETLSGLAVPLAAIFLVPAAVSAFRARQGRRLLAVNRSKESIRRLGWDEFEELIEAHYRRQGFGVRRELGRGPDGGVDVRLRTPDGETYLVQCKQWHARKVGVKIVRELYGIVAKEDAAGGIVVTAGSFTREAEDFARGVEIELIDGDRLQGIMRDLPVHEGADAASVQDTAEQTLCPQCGSALVLKTARRGRHAGSTFYGCSSFPACRFIRSS